MEDLAAELISELDSKISFVVPIFDGIPIPNSVVVTWGIMAFVMILTLIFVRNLKIVPTGPQV